MYRIALTGGIAAGKSAVATRFVELGAVHIDADVVAREVVEPGTPGLTAIERTFGPSVLTTDGRLDRAALGAIVFSDPAKLQALNDITHPEVRRTVARRMAEIGERDPGAVVVYDVPLLVEAGPAHDFDLVAVVDADRETRIARLVELRGMDRTQAERRIDLQARDEDRLAIADVVIDTRGTLEETIAQVDRVWSDIALRANTGTDVGGQT